MNNPLVSICIPAYNAAPYITETIECFIIQTYQNIEIIVQDDCSRDDTYNTALKMAQKEERIKVYQNSQNLGIGKNWNKCYEKAIGDYVVIFNADDLVPDNFLQTLLLYLFEDSSLDFCSCGFKYWLLKEDGNYASENTFNKFPDGVISDINTHLLNGNPFSHVFTVHKKKALDKLLLPDNSLFINHQVCDYELWMRMGIANFKGYHTNQIFGKYRKHLSNNSYIHNAEFSGTKVVLKHHEALKKQNKKLYKKWLFYNFYHHLKNCIRRGKMPHFKSLFLLFKFYFK